MRQETMTSRERVIRAMTLVDLTTADSCPADPSPVEEGRDLLRRIAAMLRQLSKAVRDDI